MPSNGLDHKQSGLLLHSWYGRCVAVVKVAANGISKVLQLNSVSWHSSSMPKYSSISYRGLYFCSVEVSGIMQ